MSLRPENEIRRQDSQKQLSCALTKREKFKNEEYKSRLKRISDGEEELVTLRKELSTERQKYVLYRTYSIKLNKIYNNQLDGFYKDDDLKNAINRMDGENVGMYETLLKMFDRGVSSEDYMKDFYTKEMMDNKRLANVWKGLNSVGENKAFTTLLRRLGLARYHRDATREKIVEKLEKIEEKRLLIYEEMELISRKTNEVIENERVIEDSTTGLRLAFRLYYYLQGQYARLERMMLRDKPIVTALGSAEGFMTSVNAQNYRSDEECNKFRTDILDAAGHFYEQFKLHKRDTTEELENIFNDETILIKFIKTIDDRIKEIYITPAVEILESVDDVSNNEALAWKDVQYITPPDYTYPFATPKDEHKPSVIKKLKNHIEKAINYYAHLKDHIVNIKIKAIEMINARIEGRLNTSVKIQDLVEVLRTIHPNAQYDSNAKPFEILRWFVNPPTISVMNTEVPCMLCHFYMRLHGIQFEDTGLEALYNDLTNNTDDVVKQRKLATGLYKAFVEPDKNVLESVKDEELESKDLNELIEMLENKFRETFTDRINYILTVAGYDEYDEVNNQEDWEKLTYIVEALRITNVYDENGLLTLKQRLVELRTFNNTLLALVEEKIAEGNEMWKNSGLFGISYNYEQLDIRNLMNKLDPEGCLEGKLFERLISFLTSTRKIPVKCPKPSNFNLLF